MEVHEKNSDIPNGSYMPTATGMSLMEREHRYGIRTICNGTGDIAKGSVTSLMEL